MAFAEFEQQSEVIALLQRSLDRGRLGHAYLFHGPELTDLEAVARTLAKTLNCAAPPRRGASGLPLDSCDACLNCRKIDAAHHPDVYWIRPESKLRLISVDQIRDLLQTVYLKPTQGDFKIAIIAGADRLNVQAANAFLKTLEEPPADSILLLLTTEPQKMLETILSRCLRLSFAGESTRHREPAFLDWLRRFTGMAADAQRSLLGRYRLLSLLLTRLSGLKETVTETLTQRSPLERYDDVDPRLREKWEEELTAAIEAEYRRQRAETLAGLQWWLRDVWFGTLGLTGELQTYPELASETQALSGRLTSIEAMENLRLLEDTQWLLGGNVQEALALEVNLLKLRL